MKKKPISEHSDSPERESGRGLNKHPDASANVGPAARHGTSLTLGKMSDAIETEINSKRFRFYRFGGWWFLILGSIMLLHPLAVLLDPDATMNVNGIPRKELSVKIATVAFVSIGPLLGSLIVFTPKRKLAGMIVSFEKRAQNWVANQLKG
jgi:hypothetical protein